MTLIRKSILVLITSVVTAMSAYETDSRAPPGFPARDCPPPGYKDRWDMCTRLPLMGCYCMIMRPRSWMEAMNYCIDNEMIPWPGNNTRNGDIALQVLILHQVLAIDRTGPFWTSAFSDGNDLHWTPTVFPSADNPNLKIPVAVLPSQWPFEGHAEGVLAYADPSSPMNALCYSD